MSETDLLITALLLGLYVVLAGTYGLAYTIARLQDALHLRRMSLIFYGLHILSAVSIIAWTPLHGGWKVLIVGSSVGFLAIPPITWRFLQHTHKAEVR